MLSNGDQYIYDESMQDKKIKYPVLRKRILYQTDSNNSSYQTNTLSFDLSQFANVNSGELLDFSNGELCLPLIYTLQGPSAVVGAPTENLANGSVWDFRLGPKCGAWQLIHSASITYANREVLSPSASFLNEIISFRALTSWSDSDIRQYGTQCLYALDGSNSWQWMVQDVATIGANGSRMLAGNGICNNWVLPAFNSAETALTNPVVGVVANRYYLNSKAGDVPFGNQGLVSRMKMINNKIKITANATYDISTVFTQNADMLRGKNVYDNELKNYTTEIINANANNSYQYWVVTASIPLKFISPFFEALPLCRSAYVKMQFQLNNSYVVINTPANADGAGAQFTTAPNIGFQNTCPIQISQRVTPVNHAATCTSLLATVNLVVPYSCNVANFTNPATQAVQIRHPLGSARVTIPCLELNPDDAAEYLASNSAKTIEWESYYTNYLTNVSPNNMVDYMITNGSTNISSILVIPHISASQAIDSASYNAGTAVVGFTDARSPFSAAQPSPAASYYNCQVLVGGRPILGDGQPINYNHEQFILNLYEAGKINGGKLTGLSVAQSLSLKDWSDGYRYLYAVNRDVDNKSAVSVQVKFVNASSVTHDYLFVLFRKMSMTINVANGQVIE
jgi:hypothetical protein